MAVASMPCLAIFTEAGPQIGYGHLMRCTHLASQFSAYFDIEFYVQGSLPHWYQGRSIQIQSWIDQLDQQRFDQDLVLIDSYLLTQQEVELIEQRASAPLIFIDDYPYRNYSRSIQIDWTPRIENPSSKLGLWGLHYSVFSQDLIQNGVARYYLNSKRMAVFANINSIPDAHGLKAFLLLLQAKGIELVLLGNRFDQGFDDLDAEIHQSYSAQMLAQLACDLRLVLSPGGQTMYEICALGLPCLGYMQTLDQSEDLRGFAHLQMVKPLTCEGFADGHALAQQVLEFWQDKSALLEQRNAQLLHMDFKGSQRIVLAILDILGLKLRSLSN